MVEVPVLSTRPSRLGVRRRLIAGGVFAVIGVAVVTATVYAANEGAAWEWLKDLRTPIVAAELGLFGVLAIEAWAEVIVRLFARANAIQTGMALRAFIRLLAYMILLVSIVSLLARNPALAIGVGSVTGVIVAFSAQNLLANAFAGMFLAIGRPFTVGEEITVMGLTGIVTDISVMHTRLDLGDRIALIPSSAMMSQAIQRRRRARLSWEVYDETEELRDTDSPDV
jgi:small-conductance mechanosensitive channel